MNELINKRITENNMVIGHSIKQSLSRKFLIFLQSIFFFREWRHYYFFVSREVAGMLGKCGNAVLKFLILWEMKSEYPQKTYLSLQKNLDFNKLRIQNIDE